MGSTGEADRKRRHFSSISPTGAAPKKQPMLPLSEDKKLDAAVLQFQNQKLVQKLEVQKDEIAYLEGKNSKIRERQLTYGNSLEVVRKSWEDVVDDLNSHAILTKDLVGFEKGVKDLIVRGSSDQHLTFTDGVSSSEDGFLSRLLVTGATESSSNNNTINDAGCNQPQHGEKVKNILQNIVTSFDSLWVMKDKLQSGISCALPEVELHRQGTGSDFQTEVKNLRLEIGNLLLKYTSLASELQNEMGTEAKNKAELKRLKVDFESTVAEVEEGKRKLAILKAEKDAAQQASFPVLNFGNRPASSDEAGDKHKELHDMESALREQLDQSSYRLQELERLNEERIDILKQLCALQNTLKNFKCICSSQAYLFLKDQLAKAKADVIQYQALYEKQQVERDGLAWRDKEISLKHELLDLYHRSVSVADSRISELGKEIQKQMNAKILIELKLEEASREPSRKQIIEEFKTLVSSFPNEMSAMQSELSKFKESASDVHALRAEVKSISSVVGRKAEELENLSTRSAEQAAETQKLEALVHNWKQTEMELKLILEMFRRESTASRDVLEARDSECKAWAKVESLKNSLDEHNLELRVKAAIEAEAKSQQKLAATEAEIAELRQNWDTSKRETSRLSEGVKSKLEETEAYLSEIETIGQAYDDMQNQNQQLLQQITERDDYNIKLVLEGVRTRQLGDGLHMETLTMRRAIQLANGAVDFHNMKVARIEDQLKICSDQIQKLAENRVKSTFVLENNQKRLLDLTKSSQKMMETIEEFQSKVDGNRLVLADLQIETENDRFKRKREEEDLEFVRSKAARLSSPTEGSSVVDKLRQEVREYREILKCSICLDRRKEVVIGKCYHLFCNPCVQKIIQMRQRRCPVCAASFGVNDVKPVYI